jgi:membrane-bound lytic murein transglycosylase D
MKKVTLLFFSMVLAGLAAAQKEPVKDTLVVAQASALMDSLVMKDTVKTELVSLPSNLDFVPADESPELIADRLGCLQQTIELPYNSKVHAFVDYFTVRDREYIRMVLRRKNLYFPLFEKKLKEYGLPDELKYLSIIESGLNPKAISSARAVGLWQFMSGTGKYFSLRSDWFTDDRMDPEKATEAACQYLGQLYSIFNDWHLALAAYNSGPGTVLRAIKKSGGKRAFWDIYNFLPRETRSYVPQFIAVIYAVNFAEEHNIHEVAREELVPHDTVSLNRFFHFETFAKLTGVCPEDLQFLNPHIKKNAVPEDGKIRTIKVPRSAKEILAQNRKLILDSAAVGKKEVEALAKSQPGNTFGRDRDVYYVQNGDALSTIAYRFGVSVASLREWNNLNGNLIRPGQRLVVWFSSSAVKPSAKPTIKATTPSAQVTTDGKTYIVQPGDTLWDISKKIPGVSIEKIKSLNNLKGSKLQPGQKLIVG